MGGGDSHQKRGPLFFWMARRSWSRNSEEVHRQGRVEETPKNSRLVHAMGPNVAGMIETAIAVEIFLTMLK
jgi:Na+-transporting methylmalonyl-CoA/oxaloacetate decarboxylase beta subunit